MSENEENKDDPWKRLRDDQEEKKPLTLKEKIFSLFRRPKKRKKQKKVKRRKQKKVKVWRSSRVRTKRLTWRPIKCLVSLILLFLYFITTVTSAPVRPEILVLFIPTLLILLDYVQMVWYGTSDGDE